LWDDYSLRLMDVTSADDPVEIGVRAALNEQVVDLAPHQVLTSTIGPFPVYDRSWQLSITPTSGALRNPTDDEAPVLLIAGLLVVGLLEAFLLLVTGLERQARREAASANFEATHDHLTGLFNRRAFMSQLGVVCERSRAENSDHALLYLDVDRFKQVNDVGGHEAGDAMLQELAGIFRAQVRSRDVVARIGGDEFAVILNNCHVARAVAIAQGLVAAVNEHSMQARGRSLAVGLSVGVAAIDPDDPVDADEVVRRADEACYVVKRTGRGGVHSFAAHDRASRGRST
jgi:diguanylate cyclase (GGDEF)-like protein